jgi:hypothetical protein
MADMLYQVFDFRFTREEKCLLVPFAEFQMFLGYNPPKGVQIG